MADQLPANALRLDHHINPIDVDQHGHPLGHVTATTHADGDTLTDAATQLLHRMPAPLYRALRHAMETIDR